MYENFAFKKRDGAVAGYHYPCREASHVMCLIHGIGEHAGRYRRMAEKLSSMGIATVSMDLRGHGISKGVRGDTAPREEVLADIDALLEYAGNSTLACRARCTGTVWEEICVWTIARGEEETEFRRNISSLRLGSNWFGMCRQLCTFWLKARRRLRQS